MTLSPPPAGKRVLPVFACINHTLTSTLRFRDAALRIGLPWIVVLSLLNIALMFANRGADFVSDPGRAGAWPDLLLAALSIVGASSIAVNWHRYILRDELPQTLSQAMRLDAPVWRYAFYTLGCLILVLVPVIVLLNISLSLKPLVPLVLVASFTAGVMFMRLCVALPAKALEQQGFGMRQALEATRGNMPGFAGIVFVNACVIIVALMAMGLVLALVLRLPLPLAIAGSAIISITANLFITIFGASLLSSLYGFFVEKRNF